MTCIYTVHVSICALCSVPELRFIEPQGLTSDHVKELTEEVEKLAREKVGEVGKRGGEREKERERERERGNPLQVCAIVSHSVA